MISLATNQVLYSHFFLTNFSEPVDRTAIEPLMHGYYQLLSQQYGSSSDYLGSIPTFIKYLKKFEGHVDQVIKVTHCGVSELICSCYVKIRFRMKC
jgi:hypothetical protein